MLCITVVMPVRDEARHIRATIEQILAQDYPADRYEIIVADGGSDDGTPDIVREIAAAHPNVRLVDNPGRRSAAGRNIGFRLGRGDVFLVIDGHCHIPGRDLLAQVDACFRESGADCLGRPQPLTPPGLSPFQKAVALARASRLGHGTDSLIYDDVEGFASPVSNGAAYRREVFERVGYVDETFDACEDVEFNWRVERAGMRCFTSPRLTVQYYPRETLSALWRQMLRYGRGRFRLFRKHPGTLGPATLIPPAFVAGTALCLLGAPLAGLAGLAGLAALLLAGPAAYAGIVLAESARLARRTARGGLSPALPAIFPVIHGGLGTGFLLAALFPNRGGRTT